MASEPQIVRCEPTAQIIAQLQHPSGWNCLPYLIREAQAGVAEVWRISDDQHSLLVITRLDHNPTEWVIAWARGTGSAKFGPLLVAHARRKGWPIRIHVGSLAKSRLFKRAGFAIDEYVMRA
jgi:hypothetical protein